MAVETARLVGRMDDRPNGLGAGCGFVTVSLVSQREQKAALAGWPRIMAGFPHSPWMDELQWADYHPGAMVGDSVGVLQECTM